ncbi:hypothetical protein [Catellatospora bangladeshensis]|uniref:Uncharacterized protein n=1 Tax=Catellatospora bangladeshensis TaxID=310355 RepID=A0A8J3JM88_9ACTN|nr:hypothetical protein [Catellatospora bangladeshensis]GIF83182.1 hypothetical protein Cba03nite_45310 [Catellatospora bangladeshensis]
MVSTAQETATPESAPDLPVRPVTSYRTDLVTVLLGTWFTIGLMVDAWAHNNVPELETFFTPWHAVFYWGFLVTAACVLWTCRAAFRGGRLPDFRAMPAGYPATVVALGTFAVSGLFDFGWHTLFGIEQNTDILFSPSHLGLVTSMVVIVTTPLRTAWARRDAAPVTGLRALLPAVLSTALAATLVLLFLQYANALVFRPGSIVVALTDADEYHTSNVVTSILVTNLVLIVPLLTLAKRWVLPVGSAAVLYAVIGGLCAAIADFRNLEIVWGLLVAGVLLDLVALWLQPSAARPGRLRAYAMLAGLLTWSVYLGTAVLAGPSVEAVATAAPQFVPEIYTGVPVVQALLGLVLAAVMVPVAAPLRGPDPAA